MQEWVQGRKDRGIKLSALYEEGWRLIDVIKTNQSAKEFQVLLFLEIDKARYPETFFAKLPDEQQKQGSESDL